MTALKELTVLCKKHFEAKEILQRNKDKIKEQEKQVKDIERLILAKLDEAEIKNYQVPELGTFGKRTRTTWNLPKSPEDKKAYFDFLKDKGVFEAMATVNSNTHTKFCNELIDELTRKDPLEAANFEIPGVTGKSSFESMSFRKA